MLEGSQKLSGGGGGCDGAPSTARSSCPWVQVKSDPSLPMCVGGMGGNSYSMILPLFLVSSILMNTQMR